MLPTLSLTGGEFFQIRSTEDLACEVLFHTCGCIWSMTLMKLTRWIEEGLRL